MVIHQLIRISNAHTKPQKVLLVSSRDGSDGRRSLILV